MTEAQLDKIKVLADSVGSELQFCEVEHGHEFINADGQLVRTGPGRSPFNWISLTVHRLGTPPGGFDPILAVDISPTGKVLDFKDGVLKHPTPRED